MNLADDINGVDQVRKVVVAKAEGTGSIALIWVSLIM